jgi:hypothetical protein
MQYFHCVCFDSGWPGYVRSSAEFSDIGTFQVSDFHIMDAPSLFCHHIPHSQSLGSLSKWALLHSSLSQALLSREQARALHVPMLLLPHHWDIDTSPKTHRVMQCGVSAEADAGT